VEGEPRVDDLVDDDDIAAADLEVEVLEEADAGVASELGGAVACELDEVERVRDRDRAREVDDERDARLERPDEDRLTVGVVACQLGSELLDAGGDLGGAEVDLADAFVEDQRLASGPRLAGLRRTLEPVTGCKPLEVTFVEQLDPHVRVELPHLAQLAVLAGHERLLHHGHFQVQILVGEVEVGRERLDHATLLVALEHEGMGLVEPRHTVVVEDLGVRQLRVVDETWCSLSLICLEMRRFQSHLHLPYQSCRMPPAL